MFGIEPGRGGGSLRLNDILELGVGGAVVLHHLLAELLDLRVGRLRGELAGVDLELAPDRSLLDELLVAGGHLTSGLAECRGAGEDHDRGGRALRKAVAHDFNSVIPVWGLAGKQPRAEEVQPSPGTTTAGFCSPNCRHSGCGDGGMSKISFYYLHPLLAGSMDLWPDHLDRIAAMGFGAVAMAPPFLPGAAADLFLTADHDRLDPRLGSGDAVAALARLAQRTRGRGLLPMLDVVTDAVAAESSLAGGPYRTATDDEPPDPRRPPLQRGVARLCGEPDAEWWSRRLIEWADAGIGGFRCLRPHRVPAAWWREVIATVRARHAGTRFMAWTLGLTEAEAVSLSCSGFDLAACCSRGWDYRSGGYGEAVGRLAHLAPLVAMPEAPFERRLSRAFTYSGRARRAADRAVAFSAVLGA